LVGHYVLTPQDNNETQRKTPVPVDQDYGNGSLQIRGFKECCISGEINGMEDEEKVANAGSEDESVSSEYETKDVNCEVTEAEKGERNGEQSETDEAE
jgi:hypothetical protein